MVGCGRTAREALAAGCVVLLMNTRYDGIIDHQLVQEPDFDFSGNQGRFRFKRLLEDLSSLAANRKRIRRLQRFSRAYAVENLSSREMAQKVLAVYVQAVSSLRSKTRINLTGSMGIPAAIKLIDLAFNRGLFAYQYLLSRWIRISRLIMPSIDSLLFLAVSHSSTTLSTNAPMETKIYPWVSWKVASNLRANGAVASLKIPSSNSCRLLTKTKRAFISSASL